MSATDIGIDLGTANVIITLGDKGIVVKDSSFVAYDKKMHCVLAVGNEAYKMIGRTPEYIVAVKPLKDGVISDNEMTEAMIIVKTIATTAVTAAMTEIMITAEATAEMTAIM